MRRAFLDAHGLRYSEELRLGEDYDLYARALANGARYKVVHGCGYAAVVRPDSLSGRHRTRDLQRLYEANRAILAWPAIGAAAAKALRRHERHARGRYELRRFLDAKSEAGLWRAGLGALARPAALPAIVGGLAADKLDALQGAGQPRRREAGCAALPAFKPGRLPGNDSANIGSVLFSGEETARKEGCAADRLGEGGRSIHASQTLEAKHDEHTRGRRRRLYRLAHLP